jgi:hypothetical protein
VGDVGEVKDAGKVEGAEEVKGAGEVGVQERGVQERL